MPTPPRETLTFPAPTAALLAPYLPPPPPPPPTSPTHSAPLPKPYTTLTYATSLDASLSLTPHTPTPLSSPLSKAMTHHLRTHHSAILIGVGTAISDNPSLNSRIAGTPLERQPRPVVLDPRGRWGVDAGCKMVGLAREGRGKAPWVVTAAGVAAGAEGREAVEGVGGRYFELETDERTGRFEWGAVLGLLAGEGIASVMVEGGGCVVNELLGEENVGLVDAVVVTVAPVWLGRGGVLVSPEERRGVDGERVVVRRLRGVRWVPLGEDVVLCGRVGGGGGDGE